MKKLLGLSLALWMSAGVALAHENAKDGVHFVMPAHEASVEGAVNVKMAVEGMAVQKAGELMAGTGHFHIIIDGSFVSVGEPVAKDATHLHFGKGQTEATLDLPKGQHVLTLQFADGHHISYGEAWSQTIHVSVK